jgi:thioredoxin-like negative regulator of GroEL
MVIEKQFNSFEELLSSSDLPLLVVFYAPWCGPSHLMDTVLEQVDTQMKQQLRIAKINSEEYSDLATQHHVHALPSMVLFKQKQPIGQIEMEHTERLMSAEHLIQHLQSLLQSKSES